MKKDLLIQKMVKIAKTQQILLKKLANIDTSIDTSIDTVCSDPNVQKVFKAWVSAKIATTRASDNANKDNYHILIKNKEISDKLLDELDTTIQFYF